MDRGATLPELIVFTLLIGVAASIVTPTLRRSLDHIAVVGAAQRFSAIHEGARMSAISRGRHMRYELSREAPEILLAVRKPSGVWDTLGIYPLGRVDVNAGQRIVTFNGLGIGAGASNIKVVFARGAAAETLTVSRTGRLRRQ
jgi:type II secretory pathway pseudopilin PulG